MLICGVDDSGRGPVIGPMVMAGVIIEEKDEKKFDDIGVKDSKLLTSFKRSILFDKIKEIAKGFKIILVEPCEVDGHINLNKLEAEKAIEIINDLKPSKAILDCPSPNIKAWKEYVYERLEDKKVELIAKHKADRDYLVVGAASILAKVTRDREVEEIKKKYKIDFGSGYSSDPKTREFLKENWEKYPEIFRQSWTTWLVHKDGKNQRKLDEF